MKIRFTTPVIFFALIALSGCAGTNFVRVNDDALVLGKTTREQIEARLGTPYREGAVLKNGQRLKTISYAYSSTGGEPVAEGVIPARSQGFYFLHDRLVGYEFTSSWKVDSSDFDDTKVDKIRKGVSTVSDVERLLGPPGGKYIYPLIKQKDQEAINYLYSQTSGSSFNLKFFRKLLIVTFNNQGIVTNVEYSEAGKK